MLKNKLKRVLAAVLSLQALFLIGAAPSLSGEQRYDWQSGGNGNVPQAGTEYNRTDFPGYPMDRRESEDETEKLTVEKEVSNEKLYTDALTEATAEETRKFTKVKKGDFVSSVSLSGAIEYTSQKEVTVTFPYGKVYINNIIDYRDDPYRKKGDVLATIFVELDEIEVKRLEMKLSRMVERGEFTEEYIQTKDTLAAMLDAARQTEIVMEEDGYLLDREYAARGTQISAYHYILANPKERLISVSNTGNNFRFGQQVTVTAQSGNQKVTGIGTVVSASSQEISAGLAGTTAYIKLNEDSEEIYSGFSLQVSTETIHMNNVLLLPVSAVFMNNGAQMVKLQDQYGLHVAGFFFGRKNTSDYWVLDGLTEGTEVLVQ